MATDLAAAPAHILLGDRIDPPQWRLASLISASPVCVGATTAGIPMGRDGLDGCTASHTVVQSRILAKVDGATRAFHAPSDEPWLALVDVTRTITRVDYARLLIERYGFEAPLEAALAYTPQLGFILDTHHRFRAGMIAQDLLELGLSAGAIAAIPQCMIAPFATPAEALGWLYVHERCTLLFEHVALHLRARLPDVDHAMSYLRCNQNHIGAAWEEFGDALDGAITTAELEEQLIAAAKDAFQAGRRWQVRAFLDNRLN